MKSAILASVFLLLFLGACKLGPGKMPNPQWQPTVNETRLYPTPAVFFEADYEMTLTEITWVETITYKLFRMVDRCEYELVLRGTVPYAGPDAPPRRFKELPVRFLDAAGEELPMKISQGLHARGPVSEAGTLELRAQYSFNTRETRPATFLLGDTKISLAK